MEEHISVRRDITHTIFSVLFILLLIASSFWILRPFLISIVWGTIIAVASWPLKERIQKRLANKRGPAVSLMAAALLVVVLTPLLLAVLTIAKNVDNISAQIRSFDVVSLVSPPHWVQRVPLVGKKIAGRWTAFAALSPEERAARISPYAQKALWWFVEKAGGTGVTIVDFVLTMVIAIILFAKGEVTREGVLSFARRLAGKQGEAVALLAAKAVRGVVLGVLVTALTQAAIGGTGLFIAGVPAAGLLTAVMFILCLAQLGPFLVLVPSIVWLYWSGEPIWGTVLLVFSLVAGTIDNFLKPVLIKRGVDLPLLLILSGVIGGLLAFGIIGLFVAPVILAVSYTLLKVWVSEEVAVVAQVEVLSETAP